MTGDLLKKQPAPKQLRPHQEHAIALLRQSLGRGNKRVMVQAPTGFGKTVLASHIVKGALDKGNRVMFVVPAISLVDQSIESFEADGIHAIGVVQANHHRTDCRQPVQVCSVQTIMRRRNKPDADLVIVDEAHRWFKFFEGWFDEWNAVPFVGLSATPWTKGLGKHYQDLVIASTTAELIEQGYLSKFRVFAPSTPDLKGVRTVAGDYHEGDLSEAMDTDTLTADIVSTWAARAEGRPTLVYGVDCAHAKHLRDCFVQAGIPAGYMDAYTELEERQAIARQFHDGEIKVVCNVGVLTTGIDWDVRCIVLARPTKSEILFTQIIGRGLRTAPGKDDCLILDHSSTHSRLGFVTDITHDTLHSGKANESGSREQDEKLPKPCGKCKFLKPVGVHACPSCGFAPEKQTEIVTEAGELVELSPSAASKRNRKTSKADKQRFFSEILCVAKERGYSQGWASHTYKSRYGVWPNAMEKTAAQFAGSETRSYVKSLMIRNAKRKSA